jgi:hypothetical protein
MDRKLWNEPFDERLLLAGAALARGELLRVDRGQGALLLVERGEVWVTQSGDPRDVVLSAGSWFRLDRDGTAIVQARRAASLTLTGPLDAPLPAIRTVPRAPSARAARRRGHGLLRALAAWWLRRYRRTQPSAARRYAALV